ncbi:MAG: Vms1/Ankzf1 family peptidyl-tRNA hydrolase [Gammaproteobacteria bacterium]
MPKRTIALAAPLREELGRLAAFEPTTWPVLSLYLDLRPDQHGRRHYDPFLRKTFPERSRSFKGEARQSFDRDTERIRDYLAGLPASANGAAIFACAAEHGFFEAVALAAPVERHELHIGASPHLYPLARLSDQYPRYAALLVDTNSARLFVFSLGRTSDRAHVSNVKTRRASGGGWSEARYQRHVENFHQHHMKEVVGVLERVVREEGIEHIVAACDEVARPLLMEQLPDDLADRLVDIGHAGIRAPEHEVLAETFGALRQRDADTDLERVEAMLGAWRAGGLAVAGPDNTLDALAKRQVEELLIAAAGFDDGKAALADELVRGAHQNGARVRFIEDASLLEDVGGVGALLRFKIQAGRGR